MHALLSSSNGTSDVDDDGDDGTGQHGLSAVVWCLVLALGSMVVLIHMLYLFHHRPRLNQQVVLRPLWNYTTCELVLSCTLGGGDGVRGGAGGHNMHG